MSGEIPPELAQAHQVRRILRTGSMKFIEAGVLPVDVGIGAVNAAFDIAELFAGEGLAAVEWLRNAVDMIERAAMEGAPRVPE